MKIETTNLSGFQEVLKCKSFCIIYSKVLAPNWINGNWWKIEILALIN
jgi:hypothetical protein